MLRHLRKKKIQTWTSSTHLRVLLELNMFGVSFFVCGSHDTILIHGSAEAIIQTILYSVTGLCDHNS